MSDPNKFDFSELFKQFDPMDMAKQFQEAINQSPLKNLKADDLLEMQKKTLDTMLSANQTAMEGARDLFSKQSEMMQQAVSDTTEAVQKMTNTEPSEIPAEQAAVIEDAIKKSMQNFSEIAEMIQSTYGEVSKQMEQRMRDNAEELKQALNKSE